MKRPTSLIHNNVIKVSARAFANPFLPPSPSSIGNKAGGNPVTIFHFPSNPSTRRDNDTTRTHSSNTNTPLPTSKTRTELAKSCHWESVITYSEYPYDCSGSMLSNNGRFPKDDMNNLNNNSWNRIWFYMPSGEEVSFCAHAAMAACSVIQKYANNSSGDENADGGHEICFLSGILSDEEELDDEMKQRKLVTNQAFIQKVLHSSNSDVDGEINVNEVSLKMSNTLDESTVNYKVVTKLLNEIGLSEDDISSPQCTTTKDNKANLLPSCINSSVARNKTLIPLKSESILHSATNPKDELFFRDLCDEIGSTGLYLYTPSLTSSSSYECRQYPRFSGYPEDPATGIAAAALANSLHSRKIHDHFVTGEGGGEGYNTDGKVVYEIFQGTAMGKPSRIKVSFDDSDDLTCSGVVEVDDEEEM